MEYTIQKLAKLAGISTRTLRYYDEIGLLSPAYLSESGYRIYKEAEVDALQQILFYREMGLELSKIKQVVTAPSFNRLKALKDHLETLELRRQQLSLLIKNVTKTINQEERNIKMTDQEKFEGLKKKLVEENEEKYGAEIRENYGKDTVEMSNAKMMNLSLEEYDKMQLIGERIKELLEEAVNEKVRPSEELGLRIALLHKEWLNFTWPKYSKEAHNGLAEMYVADERFTSYYDSQINGCAAFLRDAVKEMTSKP